MSYTYTTAGDLTTLANVIPSNSVTYTLGYTGAHELDSDTTSKPKFIWDPEIPRIPRHDTGVHPKSETG
ncbi:MAG TPA: hypothetical protein VGL35_11170 [Rhizomicrobium sp.]|jgi:hypothetical protein